MNFKTTIVLIIVLAGVGAYLFFSRSAAPPSAQINATPAVEGPKLIDMDSSQVQRIAITPSTGQPIVLERTGESWHLTQPVFAPADPSAVATLLDSITGLHSTGQIAADQKAAAGLDHPPYTVQLTGPKGEVATIAFGNRPLIGNALDVVVDGRDKPDVITTDIYTQLDQPASAYRKMNLVSVNSDQIRQVKIMRPSMAMVELEKNGDDWQLIGDRGFTLGKADPALAGDVASALSELSAKQFIDDKQPPDYFGLARPSMTVWFSTGPRQTVPGTSVGGTTILFGRPVNVTKADVYASIDGQVVIVPAVSEEAFEKSALDLRDKTLLDIDPATVDSITIKADRSPEAKKLGPNIAPRWNITLERKEESHVAGPPAPATHPATAPASRPAESHWDMRSGMRVTNADDTPVDALLQIFHPLTVQKYIAAAAATQPASTYDITIKTNHGTKVIKLTDPGDDKPLIGSYGDAIFELDRGILAKIDTRF